MSLVNIKAVHRMLERRINEEIAEIIDSVVAEDRPALEAHVRAHYDHVSRRRGHEKRRCEVVLEMCASEFGVTADQLLSPMRTADVAMARQVSMALCRRLIEDIDLRAIATAHGREAHGTVMHAIRVVQDNLDTDSKFADRFDGLRKNVELALQFENRGSVN